MVGVQDQDKIEGVADGLVADVLVERLREHHVQEIGHVTQAWVGVVVRLADRVAISVRGNRTDLADQPRRRHAELLFVVEFVQVRVKARQRIDHRRQNRHWWCGTWEAFEMMLHPLVQIGETGEIVGEAGVLGGGRQLAKDQQPGDLDEVWRGGELFDRYTTVAQDAVFTVDEGDVAQAAPGIAVPRVERDVAGALAQVADVDCAFTLHPGDDRQLMVYPVEDQGGLVGHGGLLVQGEYSTGQSRWRRVCAPLSRQRDRKGEGINRFRLMRSS